MFIKARCCIITNESVNASICKGPALLSCTGEPSERRCEHGKPTLKERERFLFPVQGNAVWKACLSKGNMAYSD
jgi:hypothetical protein